MNYSQFKKIDNIEKKLLTALGAIKEKSIIIKIDNYPNFDLSNYDKFSINTLFFEFNWNFNHEFKSILNVEISNTKVFHYEDLRKLAYENKSEYNSDEEEFLNNLLTKDEDLMASTSYETRFESFKLNNLNISAIDNIEKKIIFSGAYEGDTYSIQPMDWNIFSECHFIGISVSDDKNIFYQELLSEAYSQKAFKNFKIAYFIAFSALENYINEKMNTHDTEERLKDIIKKLFKNFSSIPLKDNQVYTSIYGYFSKYTLIRNKIAHGRQKITISESDLNEFFLFILTLISSVEGKGTTFKELSECI